MPRNDFNQTFECKGAQDFLKKLETELFSSDMTGDDRSGNTKTKKDELEHR